MTMHTLDDDELIVTLSALEHYSYCPRQCALIHVEQTFSQNLYTVRGDIAHARVHSPGGENRRGVTVRRGVALWSRQLGITGKADAVEFVDGVPYPVEYKVGKRRPGGHEEVQLCAQALCLEEMFGVSIPEGAIFYHEARQRVPVPLDDALRARTLAVIAAVREMIERDVIPPAPHDARCAKCSLIADCLPEVTHGGGDDGRYFARLFVPLMNEREG